MRDGGEVAMLLRIVPPSVADRPARRREGHVSR
jgi:hypothetical protein